MILTTKTRMVSLSWICKSENMRYSPAAIGKLPYCHDEISVLRPSLLLAELNYFKVENSGLFD